MPLEGIGTVAEVIHISDPAQYGAQPTTQEEAVEWLGAFTKAWQDKQRKSAIVIEPYEG
jgi:hypothetical protein